MRMAPRVGQFPPRINGSSASLTTVAGVVSASWQRNEDVAPFVTVSLTVPLSSRATVAVSLASLTCHTTDVVVTEGEPALVVWSSGKFHKVAQGVLSGVYVHADAVAKANGAADAIEFNVTAGAFKLSTSCAKLY